jgi:calcineurin-like phosphoesterase family protein
MKYFFSSDYHFNHKNIIRYENRPFETVEEMNETIIKRHNERVKPEDMVFFCGDWGFYASKTAEHRGEGMPIRITDLQKRLNGIFYSIKGNHDRSENKLNIPNYRMILNKGGIYICLTHRLEDAIIYDYNYYYPLLICGHAHSKWQTKEIEKDGKISLAINVSVENNDYYSYSFDEIMAIFHRWLSSHPKRKEINKFIIESRTRPIYVKDTNDQTK